MTGAEEIQCSIIRDPTPEVFDRCLDVLAQSFKDCSLSSALQDLLQEAAGGAIQQRDTDPSNLDNLYAHLRTRLIPACKGEGQAWIARRGEDGPIEAVAVVTYPGKPMHDLPTFKELFPALKARYTPEHQAWLAGDYSTMWDLYKTQPPLVRVLAEDYEIVLIGTHPTAQRQGFGNALMKAIADHAVGDGRGVFLMTQSHERAKTYANAGYTQLYVADITFADGEKVPNISMERRPPGSSSNSSV